MSTEGIGYSSYSATSLFLQNTNSQAQSVRTSGGQSDKGSSISSLRSQIDALLANIPKGSDNKLSFKEVHDYLEEQEKQWDETVKADLKELGVNTYEQFPLSYDPKAGTVTVAEGHPDKAVIDKYFADNPDKVAKFEEIIQIGKLTNTSKSNLTPVDIKRSIQQQSMAIWFEDNSDPTTWFSGGGMMFGAGNSSYTGLNIKV